MKVLKFGGTSVGTVESLLNVKKIVENLEPGCIVVVSALGGLTDRLLLTSRMAAEGNRQYADEMQAICRRHFDIIESVVPECRKAATTTAVDALLQDLARIYDGIFLLKEASRKSLDSVVSFGERMSSIIVTAMLESAEHRNSLEIVKTERWFDKDIADTTLTNRLIRESFSEIKENVAIMGGFISTDRDSGEITNLGRGGSDFTAALVAAALDAEVLEIWTDVDGFMTSDPRKISGARIIPEMSFVESMELCSFGAKVIYPPTIYPVFHKNIPIRILNTFNPGAPGTLISDKPDTEEWNSPARGVSALRQTCLVTVKGEMAENVAGINSRTFNAMAKHGISVFLVAQPDDSDSKKSAFSFAVLQNDVANAVKALQNEFAPELTSGDISEISPMENLATIAVVGEHIKSDNRIGPRIINMLMRNGIDVKACSIGVSETTMTFVLDIENTDNALQLIHELFFS